ncbi:hypothetical protein AVEN_181572-1 [Araneus ventricosus]|uniref:Uncharacterized protein n=1 Tax=Araneus ventricosus TaxID=182803 RepID=A0A4Y2E570_ARAVE|nr:hypothetical protein AVEN_181572-1 [Araneus ventricosus]
MLLELVTDVGKSVCCEIRKATLKPGPFGRKRHELDSPKLGGRLPHHLTLISPSVKAHGNELQFSRIFGPPTRLSPKRSQNLTSPLKKPTVSDKEIFLDRSVSEG